MQTFAHVVDGTVREILTVEDGLKPGEDVFRPEFAAALVACNDSVAEGDLYAKGKFKKPPPQPDPVPPSISAAQAKIQLRRSDLREKVEAAIAKADDDVKDWYALAGTWERNNAYVAAIGELVDLDSAAIDDLFRQAVTIGS